MKITCRKALALEREEMKTAREYKSTGIPGVVRAGRDEARHAAMFGRMRRQVCKVSRRKK